MIVGGARSPAQQASPAMTRNFDFSLDGKRIAALTR